MNRLGEEDRLNILGIKAPEDEELLGTVEPKEESTVNCLKLDNNKLSTWFKKGCNLFTLKFYTLSFNKKILRKVYFLT